MQELCQNSMSTYTSEHVRSAGNFLMYFYLRRPLCITLHDHRAFAVSCHPPRNSRPKPGSAHVFCEHVFERDRPRVYILHAVPRADALAGLAGPSALRYAASAYQFRSESLGEFKQRSAVDHGVRDRIRISTRPSAGSGASLLQIRQE